jgi:hypothetical protein
MREVVVLILSLLSPSKANPGCIIIEEATSGWKSLTSPDYPKKFNAQTQCMYSIKAPRNQRIEIEFVDFLLLTLDNDKCWRQSLSIRDPMTDISVGKYCGNTKPPRYNSQSNQLFMYLQSDTDGEYKGFHIKYRIYGSPDLPPTTKKGPKLSGGGGKRKLKAPQLDELSGDIGGTIDQHIMIIADQSIHRRKRRQGGYANYGYNVDYPNAYGGRAGPPGRGRASQNSRFEGAAEATVTSRNPKNKKCGTPGYPPCASNGLSVRSEPKKELKCVGCRNQGTDRKKLVTYLIWFIVIAVFGGIGWYVYQTYFADDEKKKKEEEQDEKEQEAKGNVGAATLAGHGARGGLGGGHGGFDAPPRYESWQDHAQPLSDNGEPPHK